LVICTDAHAPSQLELMRFGIATAQRGWVTPQNVINTHGLTKLRAWLGRAQVSAQR